MQSKDPSGSIFLDLSPEGGFIHFFWSYSAARDFGNYQRKLYSVDGASLKHHPKLTLLVLGSEDMEDNLVVLAIQISKNEESEDEWQSFLKRCKEHIHNFNSNECEIISDCDKGFIQEMLFY